MQVAVGASHIHAEECDLAGRNQERAPLSSRACTCHGRGPWAHTPCLQPAACLMVPASPNAPRCNARRSVGQSRRLRMWHVLRVMIEIQMYFSEFITQLSARSLWGLFYANEIFDKAHHDRSITTPVCLHLLAKLCNFSRSSCHTANEVVATVRFARPLSTTQQKLSIYTIVCSYSSTS